MGRTTLSVSKVNAYIKEKYGYSSMEKFFKSAEDTPKIRRKVIKSVLMSFTKYEFVAGRLSTFNPYTWKFESLSIQGVLYMKTPEELMKNLIMLKKTRDIMLRQSRKRTVELAKKQKKTRDNDLTVVSVNSISKEQRRMQELEADRNLRSKKGRSLER